MYTKPNLLSLPVRSAAILAACGQSHAVEAQGAGPQGAARITASKAPVVVELFQSQGCASCPPANADVNAVADRDQLGWKDTFGSPRWTARQWEYAKRSSRPHVSTPQVIINGGAAIVGSNRQQLDAAIAKAGPARGGPELSASGATLSVGSRLSAMPSAIWLVRHDPHSLAVPTRAGENGGRTRPHRDIVRELVKLGTWNGTAANFEISASGATTLTTAVLVQRGPGGPITQRSRSEPIRRRRHGGVPNLMTPH